MADDLDKLEAGLHELEPIPTHDQASRNDEAPTKEPKRTNVLGLSQHSAIWYLARIQKYSTYAFSAFAAMHVTTTSIVPLVTQSVPTSEPYLLLTREYYQSPAAEPLMVIIPMYAHVFSGLAIRVLRRNHNAKRYGDAYSKENKASFLTKFWPRVSTISKLGFQFIPLLMGHMFINRGIPRMTQGGSSNVNLSYVSHAFAKHPAISFFGFTALLGVGCFHITWGWAKWLGWTPEQVTSTGAQRELQKNRRWYIINGLAAAFTGLWMAGSFGVVARGGEAPGWVGIQYDELYQMIPILGKWM
ncbi:hypothetical protein M409DRAFT_22691 [Zasmidium cellare ATCC 36951]|uniref:Mitochondrial adapter protein MCP1 transmembrane domain-containing protein n=1 Tax=Zasmidium cellare ATCC 36951 TaxID=1080233 RepID=A0A6A6CJ51_ZASCE|nr:uncharacterized protein M409DRAFT_22691 [Zasmidium cellare ATCC 36951]KAF2167264.1 hypothetical protein M409DRAFT_22691 [Zasmidium cellare ATCC 36951]